MNQTTQGMGVSGSAHAGRGAAARILTSAPYAIGEATVHEPLRTTDFGKLEHLARTIGAPLPSTAREDSVPLSWHKRMLVKVRKERGLLIPDNRRVLREIAATIFGGGLKLALGPNHNTVFEAARNDVLEVYFRNGTQDTTWFVGLTAGTPTFGDTDTLASHTAEPTGWGEFTTFSEGARQALTLAAASSSSTNNTGNEAVFTISSDSQTIGGLIITADSTKGGTTGLLYAGVAFTGGDKSGVDTNDTLTVTVTLSTSSV